MRHHNVRLSGNSKDIIGWLSTEIDRNHYSPGAEGVTLLVNPPKDGIIDIDARWVDQGPQSILIEKNAAIRFELRRIDDNRTDATGTCRIPSLEPYFDRNWNRLLDTFPPVKQAEQLTKIAAPEHSPQPLPKNKSMRQITRLRYEGIYERAGPLLRNGLSQEKVAEQIKVSLRTLRKVLRWHEDQQMDKG